jgi:hypothetical protein
MTVSWRRFSARVLFRRPGGAAWAIEALAAADLELTIDHDMIDDRGPAVFGEISGNTSLDLDGLCDWLMSLIVPFGGFVLEWGLDL